MFMFVFMFSLQHKARRGLVRANFSQIASKFYLPSPLDRARNTLDGSVAESCGVHTPVDLCTRTHSEENRQMLA